MHRALVLARFHYLPHLCHLLPLEAAGGSLVADWLPPAQVQGRCMGRVVSVLAHLASACPFTQLRGSDQQGLPIDLSKNLPSYMSLALAESRTQGWSQDLSACSCASHSAVSGRLVFSFWSLMAMGPTVGQSGEHLGQFKCQMHPLEPRSGFQV